MRHACAPCKCATRHELVYERLLYGLSDDALVVPREGLTVKHIKTGEPLHVDRHTIAQFLVMTMVDFCEQLFSWQDAVGVGSVGRQNPVWGYCVTVLCWVQDVMLLSTV